MIIQSSSNSGFSKTYYMRFVILGFVFSMIFALFCLFAVEISAAPLTLILFLLTANMLLFPFSRYTIDSMINFAYGDSMIIRSEVGSLAINFFLWALAMFVAPFYLLGYALKAVKKSVSKQH